NFIYSNGTSKIIQLDGELIDVSIVNKKDTNLIHVFDHKDKFIANYEFGIGENKFTFKGYSIEYLISDIERILFTDVEFPWEDPKYAKRMKRLLFLYFVLLLTNKKYKNVANRYEYLNKIYIIINEIKEIISTKNQDIE